MEEATFFTVLLEAGPLRFGCRRSGLALSGWRLVQRAQPYGAAQAGREWRGHRAGLFGTHFQGALDACRVLNEFVVHRAHGRDFAVQLLEKLHFGFAPGDAFAKPFGELGTFLSGGKRLVELEQRRSFGFFGFARQARVGQDSHHQFAQFVSRRKQWDGVVVALAHFSAIQAGQGGDVFLDCRFWQREMLAVQMIEAGRNVARHFDVLDLVTAHRHLMGVEHQDVSRHEHGVHEQTCGDAVIRVHPGSGILVDRSLVGMGAIEQPLARHAGQKPGKFRNLGNVGLAIKRDLFRVQAAGQPGGSDFQGRPLHTGGLAGFDQRVVVGQEIKTFDIL